VGVGEEAVELGFTPGGGEEEERADLGIRGDGGGGEVGEAVWCAGGDAFVLVLVVWG
jgi:hypothetical protein